MLILLQYANYAWSRYRQKYRQNILLHLPHHAHRSTRQHPPDSHRTIPSIPSTEHPLDMVLLGGWEIPPVALLPPQKRPGRGGGGRRTGRVGCGGQGSDAKKNF